MSNNQDQINSKDFLIGTLIGGIVGASVALFLAPKSGKELRSNLNEQALYAKEVSGQLAETAKKKTTDIIEKVKSAKALEEDVDPIMDSDEEPVQEDLTTTTLNEVASTDENSEDGVQTSAEVTEVEESAKL